MKFYTAVLAMILVGCGHSSDRYNAASGDAYIKYRTPLTSASLEGKLVLKRCDADGIVFAPTLELATKVIGDPDASFVLTGEDLSNWRKARAVEISLNENGTIKAINSEAADKSGAIITNLISTFGSLVSLALPGFPGKAAANAEDTLYCNHETNAALDKVKTTDGTIERIKDRLRSPSPGDVENLTNQLNALAAIRANIESEYLTYEVSEALTLDPKVKPEEFRIEFTCKELSEWMTRTKGDNDELPYCASDDMVLAALRYTVVDLPPPATFTTLAGLKPEEALAVAHRPSESPCKTTAASRPTACDLSIIGVEPQYAIIQLFAASHGFLKLKPDDLIAKAGVAIPQRGRALYYPLDVGFGKSRSFAMAFDEYGRPNKFAWNSKASGENLTKDLATVAGTIKALDESISPTSELDKKKARIEWLKTNRALAKEERCASAIAAGAIETECD